MMNKTVEAILRGQKVEAEKLFEVINAYNFTDLSVNDASGTILKMQVNHFEEYGDMFEFSQKHAEDNMYIVKKSDILSIDAQYEDELDSVVIMCQLPDNRRLNLVIFYISKDFSVSGLGEYYEIDLESLHEFLENTLGEKAEYSCTLVRVADKFSVFLKMICPERTYINTLDDDNWKLHVSDATNMLEISVMDDICNAFYRKDDGSITEIIVQPYGQPFMEVKMMFTKQSS